MIKINYQGDCALHLSCVFRVLVREDLLTPNLRCCLSVQYMLRVEISKYKIETNVLDI